MSMWLDYFLFMVPLFLVLSSLVVFREGVKLDNLGPRALSVATIASALGGVGISWLGYSNMDSTEHWLALRPLNLLLLGFILFLAVILTRYSQRYLAGEPRLAHYYRWFFLTIAAVLLTVMSNHLLLFWLGWVAISLCLHRLLLFYPDRPRAILAASKKFLLARSAETLLLIAFFILVREHGSFFISEIFAAYQTQDLSTASQVAACLLAAAALIKCAQFPMHGWLIQVMEAPTPVSALLHAGIINLGGFLLISFAPLFHNSSPAKWLILIVAGFGTILSALIMATRISIKVRLAWSTTAQMGLMLLELALGYTDLAILHLFAHSLYKVYAFLSSGDAVVQSLYERLWPYDRAKVWHWVYGTVSAFALCGFAYAKFGHGAAYSPWLLAAIGLLGISIRQLPFAGVFAYIRVLLLNSFLISVYVLQKQVLSGLGLSPEFTPEAAGSLADVWVISLIIAMLVIQLLLYFGRNRLFVKRMKMSLFAGFYLDEWFTRLTLWLRPQTFLEHSKASEWKMPYPLGDWKGYQS